MNLFETDDKIRLMYGNRNKKKEGQKCISPNGFKFGAVGNE